MSNLTQRQREVLALIDAGACRGVPPTVREMMPALGCTSPNGVRCFLNALVRKGFLERTPTLARALRVVCRIDGSDVLWRGVWRKVLAVQIAGVKGLFQWEPEEKEKK